MTSYFDDAQTSLHNVHVGDHVRYIEGYEAVEYRVVFDCTVCAMLPGFPEDLRKEIHKTVLKYGISMLPVNAPPADFETEHQHYRRLCDLVSYLHTIFHEVAHRNGPGADSPTLGIRSIYSQGDEEREQMVIAGVQAGGWMGYGAPDPGLTATVARETP